MLSTPLEIDKEIDGKALDINQLLRDLLDSNLDLAVIAGNHKIGIYQLIAWSKQPAVRQFIADTNELADLRSTHKAAQARHLAITLLSDHCHTLHETPRDRDLASRAARAILRATAAATQPAQSPSLSEPSGASRRSDRHTIPPKPPTPSQAGSHNLTHPVPQADQVQDSVSDDGKESPTTTPSPPALPTSPLTTASPSPAPILLPRLLRAPSNYIPVITFHPPDPVRFPITPDSRPNHSAGRDAHRRGDTS